LNDLKIDLKATKDELKKSKAGLAKSTAASKKRYRNEDSDEGEEVEDDLPIKTVQNKKTNVRSQLFNTRNSCIHLNMKIYKNINIHIKMICKTIFKFTFIFFFSYTCIYTRISCTTQATFEYNSGITQATSIPNCITTLVTSTRDSRTTSTTSICNSFTSHVTSTRNSYTTSEHSSGIT
jgi:hypothetical protein